MIFNYFLSFVGIVFFIALIVTLFFNMQIFFKIKSAEAGRKYNGIHSEFFFLKPDDYFGIFPVFYVGKLSSEKAIKLSDKKKKVVLSFWIIFSLGMLGAIFYRILFL